MNNHIRIPLRRRSAFAPLALLTVVGTILLASCRDSEAPPRREEATAGGERDEADRKGATESQPGQGKEHRHGDDDGHAHENGRAKDGHGEPDEGEGHEEGAILRKPEELAEHGVSFAEAGPGAVDDAIELSGVIRANGDRLAHIVPRFDGIVREVRRTIGDSVKAGDVLAVVESSSSLARYDLQTMIEGVVIERHVTLGEAVSTETQAFIVADLRTVWVDLSVFQKDVRRARVGQTVRVSAQHGGEQRSDVEAEITYVTPVVDEATRTATARAVLANPEGAWRPGMFVTGKIIDALSVAVAVPESALQTVEGKTVVFVATDDGVEARPVVVGRRGETTSEIVSGLEPGARYAAAGTFLLKAELGKGEAEHEH